jgi:hypothetical protein
MLDRIPMDIDIISTWFGYSDMNIVLDVEYPDSDMEHIWTPLNKLSVGYS